MSTDTPARASRTGSRTTPTATSGPLARIVAGSVLAGAVGALALTLGVFPGATECTTTGAVLVAFGFGWGLLAALSSRFTTQPQRWARVPAALMGATGLGLLAFRPGDTAMSAAGWVWPVAVLALVVWMVTRIRRDLPRRGRWLLAPVVAILALAALGAAYEDISAVRDDHSHPAPGRLIEVDGRLMHLDCHGHGGPTVVLFNGMGEVSASWARITGAVAHSGRVCAYDRAGQGWSEDADRPQDGVAAARDLDALLAEAGEHGPYVLVGHSIGGPFAMTYAARYPEQVAGMVLLDSSSPEQFTRLPDYPGQYAVIRRVSGLMPTLDRLGLGRAVAAVAPSHLPAEAADQVRAVTANAHGARNARDDASMLHEVFDQAQALTSLQDRPLGVVTASDTVEDTTGWTGAQDRLAALSGNHVRRIVKSSHLGLLEDVRPSRESVRAITDVVGEVRDGSQLGPR